ncbi:MAG: DUF4124 domain-containing protein [Pseudomonadota bacterium]
MLSKADPQTRARLEALNERNRQKWLSEQPGVGVAPRSAAARGAASGSAATSGGALASPARAGASASAPSGDTLYRYRDAQGNVRFSDRYRPGAEPVSVEVTRPSAQSRAEHEARQREQAQMLEYFDERNAREAQAEQEARERGERTAQRAENCRKLFNEIQDNRRGGFISYDIGPDGERIYLSQEEVARRTDAMESDYRTHCGKLPAIDLKG